MFRRLAVFITAIIFFSAIFAFAKCPPLPEISISKGFLSINGEKTLLRAVSYSISYPGAKKRSDVSLSIIDKDLRDIKAAGFNAIRSYEPWPNEVLDLIEAHDLFLIEGIVHLDDSTNFDSEEELEEVIDNAVSIVRLHRCRKSVLFWSLWNDAPFNWGTSGGNVVSRFGKATVTNFLKKLYDAVKAEDQRPITASNVINAHFFEIGMDVVDIIGVNAYLGIYDWVTQSYSHQLGKELIIRLKNISTTYNKPIWISEMGSASVPPRNSLSSVIPQQISLISENDFIGYSIFQWNDDWSKAGGLLEPSSHIEANWGLRDAFRQPKPGFDEVVEAIRGSRDITVKSYEESPGWRATTNEESYTTKEAQVVDDFSYSDNKLLRLAYSEKNLGNAHALFSLIKSTQPGKNAFKIRFVPEDYGSWLLTSKNVSDPIDISKFRTLALRIKSVGKPVNISISLRLQDGRVFRSAPLPLSIQNTTTHLLPTSSLFLDWLSNDVNPASNSDLMFSVGVIDRIGFRINDIANFETPGAASEIVIESITLLK